MNTKEEIKISNDILDSPQKYIKDVQSIPTTIMLKSIIDQWNEGDLIIPTFQRKFVWKIEQASRFIAL